MQELYRTSNEVKILVDEGSKSEYDFIVRYQEPNKRVRTPKHMHLIIDLYMKQTGNRRLTKHFINHVLTNIIDKVNPVNSFPPQLQIFQPQHIDNFSALDEYGEYSIEFCLVVIELIMIQEKTNYPNGDLNKRLFQLFYEDADVFSVVSTATFR